MRFYMRIITLIAIIGVGIVYSNTVAYAENSKTPNHIVVFPVWAEEILLELFGGGRDILADHERYEGNLRIHMARDR